MTRHNENIKNNSDSEVKARKNRLLKSTIISIVDIALNSLHNRTLCNAIMNNPITADLVNSYSNIVFGWDMWEDFLGRSEDCTIESDEFSIEDIYNLIHETIKDCRYNNYPLEHGDLHCLFVLDRELRYHHGSSRLVTFDRFDPFAFNKHVFEILQDEIEDHSEIISNEYLTDYLKSIKCDLSTGVEDGDVTRTVINFVNRCLEQLELIDYEARL